MHKSVENVSMVISVITRTEVALVVVTKASMVINVTKVCHIVIYIDASSFSVDQETLHFVTS